MPPLALIPNRPPGAPDILSYGYGGGMSPTTTALNNSSGYSPVDYGPALQNWIDRQMLEADRQYKLQRDQLKQQYDIAKMNAKSQKERNEIDRWYNQQQVALAQARLSLEARIHEETHKLNQARLGYDLIAQGESMRGARNYVQAANYAHGVANNPYTAVAFDALANNTGLPGFAAPAGLPQAYTMATQLADFGVGGGGAPGAAGAAAAGGAGGQMNAAGSGGGANVGPITGRPMTLTGGPAPQVAGLVRQAHGIARAGGHKIGAGQLESMSPTELGLLQSAMEAPDEEGNAVDWDTFLHGWRNSRIGQSIGNSRAA